jgi:hypothetical protein
MKLPGSSDDNETNPKPDAGNRFRNIMSAAQEDKAEANSPISKLPHSSGASQETALPPKKKPAAKPNKPKREVRRATPKPSGPSKPIVQAGKLLPAFWTVASVVSMTVNIILIVALIVVWRQLSSIVALTEQATSMGTGLVGGLYSNFEKMDAAHIRTVIPIQTEVPVQFDLQVDQETSVVLSQDVTIKGARVTLQTGGLNILSAPTNIVLPAGTTLPIFLNLNVPVNTTVPIVMDVPVDIPLENTDLHEPFTGLQDILQPYYCLLSPDAISLRGAPLCK